MVMFDYQRLNVVFSMNRIPSPILSTSLFVDSEGISYEMPTGAASDNFMNTHGEPTNPPKGAPKTID